jgi:undecaprenyl-diphosphatase
VGLIVSGVCFAGFWELAEDFVASAAVARFDATVSAAIQALRSPAMTTVMRAFTIAASLPVVLAATVAVCAFLWGRQRRGEALYAAVIVGGGALLSTLMKSGFGRERPPVDNALITLPSSFSFPSGHTMGSLCLAWVLGWLVAGAPRVSGARKAVLLSLIAAYPVLVGTSRVYLGVHWPSDVLASWLLGGAWISVVTGAWLTFRSRST